MIPPLEAMGVDTLIVGAGLSGLVLARQLQAAGQKVQILEKSRGFGGRIATKRVEDVAFDTGAQFITVRDERFAALTDAWRAAGFLAPWPEGPANRLVGRPTMNAIARQLAEGLDIVREAKVVEASRLGDAWQVAVENQSNRRARTLVLTAPVPQSLALLQAGNTALPSELSADLVRLTYHPCIALLLLLDGPSAVPAEGVAYDGDGPVRWIADNTRKGVAPHVPAAVTVHLGRSFSAAHYTAAETDLLPHVMPTLGPLLGSAIKQVTVHRWKFSEPVTCHHEACVWRPEIGLGLAGDAFGGPKVEGAALSALALADRILQAR